MNPIGHKAEVKRTVTPELTAKEVGSGVVEVFATPMMVALMEAAAAQCAGPFLEEGFTTVGTMISVSHCTATPVGMTVTAEAVLEEVKGREYRFSVRAYDQCGLIGEGAHTRVAVNRQRFEDKAQLKQAPGEN